MIITDKPPKNSSAQWYAEKVSELLNEQKKSWPLLAKNYEALSSISHKEFKFDDFSVSVQCNPERIKSSSADLTANAISNRKCFLCVNNLPDEQNGLLYKNDFLFLSNPYPIFPGHFTLAKRNHVPQAIFHNFDLMLEAARDLSKQYSLYYNGPGCGASAPDHLHFQAGTKKFTQTEKEFLDILPKHTKQIYSNGKVEIRFIENYLRYAVCVESYSKTDLISTFKKFYLAFSKVSEKNSEPLMNIACSYEENIWRVLIFPRGEHRPKQFYESGEKQIIISPAYVDMCGTIILPRLEDFEKITKETIADIFAQVTIDKERFEYLKLKMGKELTN
jgi:hypothetical protein